MIKKIINFFFLFYFLALLQTSFFLHFLKYFPNLILIAIVLICLLEDQKNVFGVLAAILAGFFLDIFSERFIGYYILISLFLAIFIKLFLKTHFRLSLTNSYGSLPR